MKTILLLMVLSVFFGCFFVDTVNLGAEFTLKKGETAAIKNTNLQLKMLSAGQAQREEGGDIIFCKFEASSKNITKEITLSVGSKTTFENLNIKVLSVNTKANSKLQDPWSETSCKFVVTKSK